MLRQGWRAGFEDVESMPIDRLRDGLQTRGFAMSAVDPAPIEDLMPVPIESDRRWLARRAATEVLSGGGIRLVRYGDLVMLEPTPGAAVGDAQVADAVGRCWVNSPASRRRTRSSAISGSSARRAGSAPS